MVDNDIFRAAMRASVRLTQDNKYEEALRVLDEAIAETIRQNRISLTITMCHHAAVTCKFMENSERATAYYEQSLANSPENPVALYGLADIARSSGHDQLAKAYALRCYNALLRDEDLITREGLLEMVTKGWPEVVRGR